MGPREERARQALREFSRVLGEAISASPAANAQVRLLHHEGYSLALVLDDKQEQKSVKTEMMPMMRALPPGPEPSMRLDMEDVAFLKSVGIDPTRPVRRRR